MAKLLLSQGPDLPKNLGRKLSQGLLFTVLVVAFVLAGQAGCGRKAEAPIQTVGDLKVSFTTEPYPPSVADNVFKVKITDAEGKPVTDATVNVRYYMPAMAGMPEMGGTVQIQHKGKGLYEGAVDLSMGGKFPWEVTITIARPGQAEVAAEYRLTPTKGIDFVRAGGLEEETLPAKVETTATTLPGFIRLTEWKQQLIGVKTAPVVMRPLAKVIRTVGKVDYDETKLVSVNLKIEGWVEELFVDYTGKLVKKGQPLFTIYSPELVSVQEEYLLALKGQKYLKGSAFNDIASGAHTLLESAKRRLLLWDITEKQIEELERRGKPDTYLTIYSPVTGFVVEKNVVKGLHIMPGMDLYRIADLSTVWVYADIYEYEVPYVKVGEPAIITVTSYPGEVWVGRIGYIYPYLEGTTRTLKVRLEVPNSDLKLKPDMFANVELRLQLGRKLALPESAVVYTGKRALVFVDLGQGRFQPREVKLGAKSNGHFEVLSGVEEGEKVVTSGNFLIDSESNLRGVLGAWGKEG